MSGSKSADTVLVPWRDPSHDVLLQVVDAVPFHVITDQYIERPFSLRMVGNYIRHVGWRVALRKVVSRLKERRRNEKVAAIAIALVEAAPDPVSLPTGMRVAALLPNWNGRHRWAVVREPFTIPLDEVLTESDYDDEGRTLEDLFEGWIGWSPFSGLPLDAGMLRDALMRARPAFQRILRQASSTESVQNHPEPITHRPRPRPSSHGRPKAVLFGLGNYAKTHLLPVVRRKLSLECVHEVDPDQAESIRRLNVAIDTSPWPREEERYDAWFVAGFHSTHAPLAIEALRRGGAVVMEKPLATDWGQFRALKSHLITRPAPFFAGFHKRYSSLDTWARDDLAGADGPIDMHAIVYEIPLPSRHWYNWPSSGSRIISNGCHWLDYFCHVNGFPQIPEVSVRRLGGRDLLITARSWEGAVLTLVLTEKGSSRLGVREVIELRCEDVTVRMTDGAEYVSENSARVLRRKHINPTHAYIHMYSKICDAILTGASGDHPKTLVSTELMLRLEAQLIELQEEASSSRTSGSR